MISMPSMPSVPLMSASPSFASRRTGVIPARSRATPPGTLSPKRVSASPSPVSTSAQCASGARSPLQPSDPCSGTTGVMPAFSTAASVSATTGRMPVRADASVFSRRNISARTTSRSTGWPAPAACERMRLSCSFARRSGLICRVARAPKPVEMP
jgi:hypothetical protein